MEIKYGKYGFTIWDVGGQDKIRVLWKHYYSNADGIIYAIDASNRDNNEEDKEIFGKLMNEEEIKNPVLVYANKQDLNGVYSESEIAKILGMEKLANRKWLVKGASIFTGEGIKEGFDWLASTIIKKK